MTTHELKEYLDRNNVVHVSIEHPQTFTAQRTAQVTHIRGREMAKTVVLNMDGRACMAVLPAHYHVDFDKFRMLTGAETVELVKERELQKLFPDCETGAMPPFGNLYGMEVWVQDELSKDNEIAFNAGTHTEVMRMPWRDYENLVHPVIGDFATAH